MKQKSQKLQPWECPGEPSAELAEAFKLAESFRTIEHAPAIRTDHFLLALLLTKYPPTAEAVLKVFRKVKNKWRAELKAKI